MTSKGWFRCHGARPSRVKCRPAYHTTPLSVLRIYELSAEVLFWNLETAAFEELHKLWILWSVKNVQGCPGLPWKNRGLGWRCVSSVIIQA